MYNQVKSFIRLTISLLGYRGKKTIQITSDIAFREGMTKRMHLGIQNTENKNINITSSWNS